MKMTVLNNVKTFRFIIRRKEVTLKKVTDTTSYYEALMTFVTVYIRYMHVKDIQYELQHPVND